MKLEAAKVVEWIYTYYILQSNSQFHLRFDGGASIASSPALRFVANPNATFARSLGTGVPPCDDDSATAVADILEKPARGAGDPLAVCMPDEGAGLSVRCNCCSGAGTVMKPF